MNTNAGKGRQNRFKQLTWDPNVKEKNNNNKKTKIKYVLFMVAVLSEYEELKHKCPFIVSRAERFSAMSKWPSVYSHFVLSECTL